MAPTASRWSAIADAAMYAAKGAGRNRSAGFDPSMNAAARERLDLEGRLRRMTATLLSRGTADGELSLAYQPQVDATGRIRGVEALLRWDNPRLGRVPPNKFIPVAESSGLIVPIGTWALREACRQAAAWRAAGCRPVVVAVNVSVLQFAQPDFPSVVTAALDDHQLPPEALELELTESVLMGQHRRRGRESWWPSGSWAWRRRSTTSAPATRRWRTCAGCRSTG